MSDTRGSSAGSPLLAVTTNSADTRELARWLRRQQPAVSVTTCHGYYAAVPALADDSDVVVVELPGTDGRDDWRLAELRSRAPEATIVVIADATLLPDLSGALRADLGVTRVESLPPLRELVLTATIRLDDDQTSRRRSNR